MSLNPLKKIAKQGAGELAARPLIQVPGMPTPTMSVAKRHTNIRIRLRRAAIALSLLALASCQPTGHSPAAKAQLIDASYVRGDLDALESPAIAGAQTVVDRSTDPNEGAFVEQVLAQLSLAEKVGQMVQAEIKHASPQQVRDFHLGSVLNGGGSHPEGNKHASIEDWRALAQRYDSASRDRSDNRAAVPLLWGTDAVHGHNNVYMATVFPHNIGLGATRNEALIRDIYSATALKVRATGIKWAFAPTVAVARDDRWGRTYESYSEDPRLVAMLADDAVIGLQGDQLSGMADNHRVIATAKHFIGDGGTLNGVDQGNTVLSKEQLLDIHGRSFRSALDAGAQTVMASFNSWNGEKLHGHRDALQTLLKDEMGFDGFVIGDWNGHAQVEGCAKDSCAAAILAGVDMLMVPEHWQAFIANTIAQVESGEIPMARIDDAVRRILTVKYRAGLFDDGGALFAEFDEADRTHNQALARQAVRESLVLLKNNDQALPLDPTARLLVVGDAADDIARQSGGWTLTWQGDGNSNADFPLGTSILKGFRQAIEPAGGEVLYRGDDVDAAELAELAAQVDATVFVFGEHPYAEGTGDLETLLPPMDSQQIHALKKQLKAQGKPIVSVMVTGRPLSVNHMINASDAFVVAWLPGTEGGGIADLLVAGSDGQPRFDFTGKLPFSWPQFAGHTQLNNYPAYQLQPQFSVGFGLHYGAGIELAQLREESLLEANDVEVAGELPIFSKGTVWPWSMYVGDEQNWNVSVRGNSGATVNNETVVVTASDNATQEDARRVRWASAALGQFYFQYDRTLDITPLANDDAVLSFNVKVDTPPAQPVALRMDCNYPCFGQLDITELLTSLPLQRWQTVAVDLQCFAQQGARLSEINTPFLLSTKGEMELELSDIAIKPAAHAHHRIDCSQQVTQLH